MQFIFSALGFILFLLIFVFIVRIRDKIPTWRIIYRTSGRDFRALYRFAWAQYFVLKFYLQDATIGKLFKRQVKKHPNKSCFIFEDRTWTFQEVEDYSNQVANAFADAGYQKGDEVALFMENRPEYVCIWLGLSKIGVVTGLINTNLRLQSLANSINAITPKAIIFDNNLATAVADVIPYLSKKSGVDFMCLEPIKSKLNAFKATSLDSLLQNTSKSSPDETKYRISFKDKLVYIYTSGTTSLPKPAIIKHSRFIAIGILVKVGMLTHEDDVAYVCLPMYHTSGGTMFISNMMAFGGTVAIRKKFSVSNFWKDAVKYKATIANYIGEICRFLLNQPETPEETQHTIRAMIGNGMRSEVWEKFQTRFRVKKIIEIYGSTEGNTLLCNFFGKVGAVGFISLIWPHARQVYLIKVDTETGEPFRNKNGFCIHCKPGEPGAIVGKIAQHNPGNSFDGYADKNATKKKIITNCFTKGDTAFHSGDILVMDEDGYLYFVDRTGDTFRWRGENVSTTEMEAIISKALNQKPCVVYGVEIPGTEGMAGMVSISSEASVDMQEFYKSISFSLPTYAVPVFVRICKQLETTGTYKLKKRDLQKEGFNPTLTTDPIFMLENQTRSYVRLDEEVYNSIMRRETKF